MIYYLWLYLLITYGYKSKKIQSNFNLAKLFSAQLCLLRYTVIFSLQELLFKLTNSYRTFLIILWQEHIEILLVLSQDRTPCMVADLPRYLSSSRKIWLHSLSFQPKLVKLQQIYQALTKWCLFLNLFFIFWLVWLYSINCHHIQGFIITDDCLKIENWCWKDLPVLLITILLWSLLKSADTGQLAGVRVCALSVI